MPDLVKAQQALNIASGRAALARPKAGQYAKFAVAKTAARSALEALRTHPQKAALTKELEALAAQLDEAERAGDDWEDYADGARLLEAVRKACVDAKVKAEMHATLKSPAPDSGFLKLLMEEAGGTGALDAIVKNAPEDASRAFLAAALEARFDCKMQQFLSEGKPRRDGQADKTAPDKSVKRIYELLQKVPASHAKDNPKIANIRRFQEDTGGAAYGGGEIDLNCGRAGAGGSNDYNQELCDPKFFPDGVDDNCKPENGDEVPYFDWATLHEVGHAVDDHKGFMAGRGKEAAFGNWRVYQGDLTKIAEKVKGRFGYDLQYIKDKLNLQAPADAPLPSDNSKTPQQWAKEKADVDKWCALTCKEGLWWNGAGSKEAAIDGKVYQIAYANQKKWVRYDYDARKQGIHGYQFRAPGEWFAELYAAHFCGKLNQSHPAAAWLKTL